MRGFRVLEDMNLVVLVRKGYREVLIVFLGILEIILFYYFEVVEIEV